MRSGRRFISGQVLLVGLVVLTLCVVAFKQKHKLRFIKYLSLWTSDVMLNWCTRPPRSDAVVIVDVDEKSLENLGQWPWPRFILADLVDRLQHAGARVVVFDMVFPEPDRTSPAVIQRTWSKLMGSELELDEIPPEKKNFDAIFAQVLYRTRAVLGCYLDPCEYPIGALDAVKDADGNQFIAEMSTFGVIPHNRLMQARDVVLSLPELRKAAVSTAFFNVTPDEDGMVRRVPLVMAYGPDRIYPSLALEAVRLYTSQDKAMIKYMETEVAIKVGEYKFQADYAARIVLNYRSEPFPALSAWNVIRDRFDTNAVNGKIVFIGTSAAGLKDIKATPVNPEMAGVNIQATAADNILTHDMLFEPIWYDTVNQIGIMICGAILILLVGRVPAIWSFVTTSLVIVLVVYASFRLMHDYNILLSVTHFALTMLLVYISVTVVRYRQEERDRQKVRSMFGAMVSNDVLHYMEEHPESFSLNGRKADATVFFSDVVGFTTISEALEADRLSDLMNRYMTPMTELIMRNHGYVDKFIGDAIMAVWGVPYHTEDHAILACRVALEQQKILVDLRRNLSAEFGHDLSIRIGINTGTVTAGNMGALRRFQYTVMGDAVNQASRFEGLNKQFGTSIMIGETTADLIRDCLATRWLGVVRVKGKMKPVRIYALLGAKGEVGEEQQKLFALYEEAYQFHCRREWTKALELLDQVLEKSSQDGPAIMLRACIANYRYTPPEPSWNGEYIATVK